MAVKLRLMRVGKTKQPHYRVVAADARSPRDGRFIEIIGQYNPRAEPSYIHIDNHKAVKWLRNGAQPTERVMKLLTVSGAIEAFKAGVLPEPTPKPVSAPKPIYTPPPIVETPKPVAVAAPVETAPAATESTSAESASTDEATYTTRVTVTTIVDGVETTEVVEEHAGTVAADSVPDHNPDTTDTTVIRHEQTIIDGQVVDSSESTTSTPHES
jgi:small subunit ribosomal protein S16